MSARLSSSACASVRRDLQGLDLLAGAGAARRPALALDADGRRALAAGAALALQPEDLGARLRKRRAPRLDLRLRLARAPARDPRRRQMRRAASRRRFELLVATCRSCSARARAPATAASLLSVSRAARSIVVRDSRVFASIACASRQSWRRRCSSRLGAARGASARLALGLGAHWRRGGARLRFLELDRGQPVALGEPLRGGA